MSFSSTSTTTNVGFAAFEVLSVDKLNGFSSSSLPKVKILILDANEICFVPLLLFDAPIPFTSSEPSDIDPEEFVLGDYQ